MKSVRRGALVGFLLLMVAVTAPLVIRWATLPGTRGPSIEVDLPGGVHRVVDLQQMQGMSSLTRYAEAQNQFGNWRDGGTYTGVLLADLLDGAVYSSVMVEASDGYRVTIERERVVSEAFPMVLAYAMDGAEVPDWRDGFRIVVLPVGGRVSNEEYQAVSAGSYWARNVVRIAAQP